MFENQHTFQQKAPSGLARVQEPQPVAYKCCQLNIFTYKKTNKKIDVIKKNPNIHFACKMKGTEPSMYMVKEP